MDEKKENSANRKTDSDIAYAMIMKMKALNARKVLDQSSTGEVEIEKNNASEIIAPESQNVDTPVVVVSEVADKTAEKPNEVSVEHEECDAVAARRHALDEKRRSLLGKTEYTVYERLSYEEPKHPDELADGHSVGDIASMLVMMEVLGCVSLAPGGCYLKNENQ